MKISIITAFIIAIIIGGLFWAWSKRQTNLLQIPSKMSQTISPSPTLTPTPGLATSPSRASSTQEVKKTPTTGVNLLIPLLASAGLGLAGWYLLKKK